jgi:hypothetical protein
MRHDTNRRLSIAASLALAAGAAHADFVGFGSNSFVVEATENTYHVVEVYATFDDPTDVLLNVFNVGVSLTASELAAAASFHQASDSGIGLAPSFLPLPFLPPGEPWLFDTYVTVGVEQGDFTQGTLADPDFDDATHVADNAISGTGGWYNVPPSNGHGVAGDDLRVLLGVFVVTADEYTPGLRLNFGATVGYSNDDAVDFASHQRQFLYPSGVLQPYVADDFDADGSSDVVFVNESSRKLAVWLMNGLARKSGSVLDDAVPAGYVQAGIGDLDGNGTPDVVWQDEANGRVHAWLMNGMAVESKTPISSALGSNWEVVGVGDISGDGKGDIVLRERIGGTVVAWLMDGATKIAGSREAHGLGDLDGDGLMDIVWRSPGHVMSAWLLNGAEIKAQGDILNVVGPVPHTWLVEGIGDLDGDGRTDILWRNRYNGLVSAWLMDGLTRTGGGALHAGINTNWEVGAMRDLDGDGKSDIVWRNRLTGDVNGWIMDAFTRTQGGFIRNAPTAWAIAPE